MEFKVHNVIMRNKFANKKEQYINVTMDKKHNGGKSTLYETFGVIANMGYNSTHDRVREASGKMSVSLGSG